MAISNPMGQLKQAGPVQAMLTLRQRAQSDYQSPLALQQQQMLQQVQGSMASATQRGVNPALARSMALNQAAQGGGDAMARLGMARADEQMQSRQAFINAMLAAKQQQLGSNERKLDYQLKDKAATMANRGALITGATSAAAMAAASYGRGQQGNTPDPNRGLKTTGPSLQATGPNVGPIPVSQATAGSPSMGAPGYFSNAPASYTPAEYLETPGYQTMNYWQPAMGNNPLFTVY